MDELDLPLFGFVGIAFNPHHIEPAVPVFDFVPGHKPAGDLSDFPLLVWRDRFQRFSPFGTGPGFDLHEHQHLAVLRYDIDLPGFITVVFLDNPVSPFLEELDRRPLTLFAKMQTLVSHGFPPALRIGFCPAMLCAMILGWDDIIGGTSILAFLIWLGLTGIFYLVAYIAALNTFDHITKNSVIKIPLLLAVAPVAAFLISIFSYNPLALFVLMMISNYFRVKNLGGPGDTRYQGLTLNRPLFYTASYLYIIAVYGLSAWYQHPVEVADGITNPYWKTWFPDIHEN